MQSLNRSRWFTCATALVLFGIAACGKKTQDTSTQTSSGSIAPGATAIQVADVTVGRSITADKRIADQTDTFSPHDTIFASIHTTGSAQANLAARWTFQDGQVVNEHTESIAPSGDAYTEFQISKPSGWPAGKYTLHVLVNGQEVQTKDVTVKS
jgi:hypothetical protein